MTAKERAGLFARLSAWRRRKHELPYTADEMAVFRCRVQALVAQSRRAKASGS